MCYLSLQARTILIGCTLALQIADLKLNALNIDQYSHKNIFLLYGNNVADENAGFVFLFVKCKNQADCFFSFDVYSWVVELKKKTDTTIHPSPVCTSLCLKGRRGAGAYLQQSLGKRGGTTWTDVPVNRRVR